MKAVVKKRFRDKYTDEVNVAGSELELIPERYAEISATDANLVAAVVEESEQTAGSRRQQGRSLSGPRSRLGRTSNGERVCACIL